MTMTEMLTDKRNDKGFSLLEVAVVIMITGFVFIPLMIVLIQLNDEQKSAENIEENDNFLIALNAYVKQNNAYPCPADPTLAITDANFGMADCSISGTVRIGALPVTTLRLPYKQIANTYGWQHIYAVTGDTTATTGQLNAAPAVNIYMNDTSGAPEVVPFVVVNTGKDGKGSYTINGTANATTCTTAATYNSRDNENCDGDENFVDAPLVTTGSVRDTVYFDDTLSYGTANAKTGLWVTSPGDVSNTKKILTNRAIGKVGLGTTDPPADTLEVSGDIQIEGNTLNVDGTMDLETDVSVGQNITIPTISTNPDPSFTAGNFCAGC